MTYLPSFRRPSLALALGAAAMLTLGACGKSKTQAVASVSSVAAPQEEDDSWVGRDGVKDAIALLNQGDPVKARKILMAVLKKQPGDSIARQLVTQIDSDPKTLLGAENYSYVMKEGDSLSSMAQRHLGNPMMFYALARYNDIAVPTSVAPGQTILIPGKRPAPPPVVAKKPAAPAAKPAASAAKAATPAPKPAQRSANPGQAAKLRGQGLAAMNAGAINRAVALLRQALSFDPGSAVIKGDLGRALRIQSTVRAR